MDEKIKAAVDEQPNLELKLNKGEHHRIMKDGWHGSLWIVKTERRGYRVETTGTVGTYLNGEIKHLFGRDCDHITVKGYKIWFVDSAEDVKKVINVYGKI